MNDNRPPSEPATGIRNAARKSGASLGWLAVIAAVTFDDSLTLLLGALPFACFYFFGSVVSRSTLLFAVLSLAWILTLVAFLGVRLTPLVYVMDTYLHLLAERSTYVRLIGSFCFSLVGTSLAALFYSSRLRSIGSSALIHLAAVWMFSALYMWVFIYLLPPDLALGG